MNILSGLLLFFLGGFIGVATMCIVQIGADSEKRMIHADSEAITRKNKKE